MKITVAAKAIMATAVAVLGSLEVASSDGEFTAKELITAGIAGLAALGAVYAVPNEPKEDDVLDVPINR